MAQLIYEITGDISGLQSAINQASNLIRDAANQSSQIKVADSTPQINAQISVLEQLGKKLSVITGNTELFGESIKAQANQVSAYQTAINSLLSNGFTPMDTLVQQLKGRVDELTASLNAASNVRPPARDFIENPGFAPGIAAATAEPNTAAISLINTLNAELAAGTITVEEYNQQLLAANSTLNTLGQTAGQASSAFESELGIIAGLKQALADLNTTRLNTLVEGDLPKLNSEIQQTEIEISRLSNIGKVGFDQFGNAIRGVSVQNLNGQLVSLSNNLFGARQISRDLVRTFDAGSISGFAKAIGLLAVDFLFFAQNAQFAKTSTVGATAAIAVEGEVAAGSALSTGALGAAFASLLTPTSLIVLGIAALGAGFIAYEKSQKNATQAATAHLKAIREQKAALADYVTTLSASQQVEADSAKNYAASTLKLDELVFAVKNNTGALFDGQTALEDLQRLYPNFFANLDEAATKTDKFTEATNGARDSLIALGKFTAANKLAEQSIETATSGQVAADSLIPSLVKARQELQKTLQAAENAAEAQKIIASQAGTSVAAAIPVFEAQSKIKDILAQIQKYNEVIADANAKTKAFFDIANQNAPAAGLVTKFKGTKDVVDQFDALKQKLDEITQKNSALAGNAGITGYAAEIASIVKQFTDLNNSIAQFTIQVNKAFDRGALTTSERNALLSPLPAIQSALPKNEDAAINQAKIKNAQETADAIQRINDQFGIKEQAGFNAELSRVKKLYDNIVQEAQKNSLDLQQIEANRQRAIQGAGGNALALANIKKIYDAQIVQAQNAQAKIAAAAADLLPAIQAVDEKYIQQETEAYGKIIDIANQAFEALDSGEASRTDKINLEWQKRITAANIYFDKLRDLAKAANLSQSSTDQINTVQAQVNAIIKLANIQQVSEEISKNFASAMQGAVNGLVSNLFTSLTTLGQTRQDIDNKYFSQLASASDQATINQINNLKRLEQESTTSFGAIFSSLISKFNSTFNESILNSFTKQFTENLGKTLLAPTAKQLQISPEEQSAQRVASLLQSSGNDLASQIRQAGVDFASSVRGVQISPGLLNGTSGGSALDSTNPLLSGSLGADFNQSVGSSAGEFSDSVSTSAESFSHEIVHASEISSASTIASSSTAAAKISSSAAGLAAAASLAGGLVSGLGKPTNSLTQGLGGVLSGAGEGALIGSVIPGVGTIAGAVVGGVIGGISGLFSASKARKQEELQQQQLEQQKVTNDLLARQNALAYTTAIIGRMTTQGIVTGVDINAFGELTAKISGKDLQFILGRANNGR